MLNDTFEIEPDPSQRLMRTTRRGHRGLGTVQAYQAALPEGGARMLAAGCTQGRMVALVDARAGGAQSQDVIAAYKADLGDEMATRRAATLVTSALFNRQVKRIGISNQQLFTDEAEALTRLLSPDNAA